MTKKMCKILTCLLIVILFSGCTIYTKENISKNEIENAEENNMQDNERDKENGYISLIPLFDIFITWDSIDNEYLLKLAQYKGGSVEDRAYNILVALNNVWNTKESIETVTLRELYDVEGLNSYEWEEIIPDETTKEAMRMILHDKFDNSNGSLEYRNGDVE